MVRRLRCPCCGREVEEGWAYCPYCGCMLGFRMFDEFFERDYIRDFLEDFDKLVRKSIKEFFKPFEFEKEPYVKGGGISIVIKSESGKKPKVYVKTFGDYKEFEDKIKENIKKKIGIEEIEEEEKPKEKVSEIREVKVTEEPEVKIKRDVHRMEIEVDLPDVESAKDIEVVELEESIEIRAYAKDKVYFKIISKPKNKSIVEKKFEKGKLKLILE